ncbi:MAG: hypothetical protein WBD31_17040, partial [Rubripirellula sp.]
MRHWRRTLGTRYDAAITPGGVVTLVTATDQLGATTKVSQGLADRFAESMFAGITFLASDQC